MHLAKALGRLAEGSNLPHGRQFRLGRECFSPSKIRQRSANTPLGRRHRSYRASGAVGRGESPWPVPPLVDPKSKSAYFRPKIFRDLQLPGRILDQELLLDHFIECRLEIGARLFDSVLRVRADQVIHVLLQLRLVVRLDRF